MRKRGLNRYARKSLGKRIMKRKFCAKYGSRTNEDLVRQKYERDAESDWAWWKKRHQRNKGYLLAAVVSLRCAEGRKARYEPQDPEQVS